MDPYGEHTHLLVDVTQEAPLHVKNGFSSSDSSYLCRSSAALVVFCLES